jgi:hypothetical protein
MPRLVLVEEGEPDRVPGTNAFPGVEELVVLGDVADGSQRMRSRMVSSQVSASRKSTFMSMPIGWLLPEG